MTIKKWTDAELQKLKQMMSLGLSDEEIAKRLRRGENSVQQKIWHLKEKRQIIPESTMPKYDKPLVSEGDAVILSDVEAPYQHSDFINRVLDLADSWKIRTLHLNGDLLHFDSLSKWGAEWLPDDTDSNMQTLVDFVNTLPGKHRDAGIDILDTVGVFGGGDGLSTELAEARKVFSNFTNFDEILVAIGNHDDRYLRALDHAMKPKELLVQLDRHHDPRWKIAPYYYTKINTEKGLFRAEHPRPAGRTAAQDLAAQYHCNIIMGHSHRWAVNRDVSGDFWAIQSGHCVDEERLAYVMQRSAKRDAHCLGAVIIRGGIPWVLGDWSPFEQMKKM